MVDMVSCGDNRSSGMEKLVTTACLHHSHYLLPLEAQSLHPIGAVDGLASLAVLLLSTIDKGDINQDTITSTMFRPAADHRTGVTLQVMLDSRNTCSRGRDRPFIHFPARSKVGLWWQRVVNHPLATKINWTRSHTSSKQDIHVLQHQCEHRWTSLPGSRMCKLKSAHPPEGPALVIKSLL
ncbi:hypothetical protein INR49_009580 [Caranx melampygus]|nr:hypothetical protein INR49_009580 [Caranx melampygus]